MPLKRTLSLTALTFYGVGIILGAGIYTVLGAAAGLAGESLWLCFGGSGLLALLTALSYAELSTAHPQASAEFNYLRRAFPRWPAIGLVTGLLVALSAAATAATVAIAFGGYLRSFVSVPAPLVACGLLVVAALVNVLGVRESAWVNTLFTLLEAAGLILFVVLGTRSDTFGAALTATPTLGVVSGVALVFFAFIGFQNIANLAEEANEPSRDLPRSIFLSLAIATTLYILVALAAVALMPADQLARSDAPLADAVRQNAPRLASTLGGIALFATANTALVSILVASRVLFGIARERDLPQLLSAVHARRKTPVVAIVVVTSIAAALVPFGGVGAVASLSSFASLLAFAAVNIALIVLRYTDPGCVRPFRVPGSIGRFPILPALGALLTLAVATQLEPAALVGGSVALLVFTVYALFHRRDRTPKARRPRGGHGWTGSTS